MSEPRQRLVVDAVSFADIFRFHRILAAVTQSMQPPRLVVGLLMVLALVSVGNLWDKWFDEPSINPRGLTVPKELNSDIIADQVLRPMAENSESAKREFARQTGADYTDPAFMLPGHLDARIVRRGIDLDYKYNRNNKLRSEINLDQIARDDEEHRRKLASIDAIMPRGAYEATAREVSGVVVRIIRGVFDLSPYEVFVAFSDLFVAIPVALWDQKPWFVVVYGAFALLVLSIGGGALCRMAACELSGKERLRTTDAMVFATGHWVKLVLAPLLPLIIAGVLVLVLVVMGIALFSLPYVDVLGGFLYGINLLIGFLVAFVLIVYAGSFLMVLPSVAAENCGPADAVQRAFAYVLSRPLHLLGYVVVGVVGLAIGYLMVSLFAVATLNGTGAATGTLTGNSAVSITGGFDPFDLGFSPGEYHRYWHNEYAAFFVATWQGLVIMLVGAWVASYAFSSSTIIYMLMRKTVDDQDVTEIWRPGLVPGTLAPLPSGPAVPADTPVDASAEREPSPPGAPRHVRKGTETLGSGDASKVD